ncbi:hypothetical protein COCC4DRAFT_140535 [Bipolaris maydis ATCC 48331]|uniref:Uncharacterized protein n=2 Tax=Cochliobolus heterostrophus TaxID=5016 RepID=M2UU64_COCH5|nr:uncharacterized protein COCC4DRAFT_140535 [Bipolaris maydis ATCC 48331]EMD97126.1 hypothetical protein COCHEDRAFT_1163626 [Bipolaris maydis C5]ENI04409.1 hypothetical protein COCC4DRAFT_140535 [Bipolaris maydis ATCC 48331]
MLGGGCHPTCPPRSAVEAYCIPRAVPEFVDHATKTVHAIQIQPKIQRFICMT